jgi:murein DD-endopeptidase MepM/ murein hydrolase activator NlpD
VHDDRAPGTGAAGIGPVAAPATERRGRRDQARPLHPRAASTTRPGATTGRGRGRAAALWLIAAVVVTVAVLGFVLLGVVDPRSGGDARAAAAVGSPTPATPASPGTVAPAFAPVASAAASQPETSAAPAYSRAHVGPDGLPIVPGAGSTAADPSTLTGYAWPLSAGRITQPYGPSPFGTLVVGGELFHDGLDIASFCGDRVRAAHDGVVLAAGRRYDDAIGWLGDLAAYEARNDAKKLWFSLPITIVVDDGNGYRSMYAHLNDIAVKAGDRVKAGEFIGWEGNSGNASGCHLHYGLFSPDETATFGLQSKIATKMKLPASEIARVDPLRVLGRMPKGIEPAEPDPTPTPSSSPSR